MKKILFFLCATVATLFVSIPPTIEKDYGENFSLQNDVISPLTENGATAEAGMSELPMAILVSIVVLSIVRKQWSKWFGTSGKEVQPTDHTDVMQISTAGFSLKDYVEDMREDFDKMNFDKSQQRFLDEKIEGIQRSYNSQNPHMVGEVGANATVSGLISSSIGDLNIKVTRVTANIDAPLPFVIFGLNGLNSSFYSIIKQFLPAGIDFSVAPAVNGNLVFTYTDSDDSTDTIIVSISGVTNYLQFLNSMNQKSFGTKYILYTISDVTMQTQFDQLLNFGLLTSLGSNTANQLDLDSRIMTWQFKSDRVDVLMPEQTVGADFSFVQNIVAEAGFSVKFNVFMSRALSTINQR